MTKPITALASDALNSATSEISAVDAMTCPEKDGNFHARPDAKEAMAAGIWNAHLELDIARSSRGVRLMRSDHRGPLYVQKALYPEGGELPHLYLLHPPGGLVSGDQLDLKVNIDENSSALLTSPGAGRLYGARRDQRPQKQNNLLRLNAGSSLEWFPMETLVYSGARAETCTQVHLDKQSHFIGWDICALGLPVSSAPFLQGSLRQAFEIYLDGNPKVIERLALQAKDQTYRDSPVGLAGFSCNALFVAGPFSDETDREHLQARVVELCQKKSSDQRQLDPHTDRSESSSKIRPISGKAPMMGATWQGDWLVIRYLGDSSTLAREAFVKIWCLVRPALLDRCACLPRIWAC